MTIFSQVDIRTIPSIQYTTPTTGSTINANTDGNVTLLINPSGSLLALTVALNSSPSDGDVLTLGSSQVVTTFTMTGGTIVGALSTLAVASFATYVYSASASKWFRIG